MSHHLTTEVQEREKWEVEFDAQFDPHRHWQGDEWVTKKVKDFLTTTLTEQERRIKEEIAAKIDAREQQLKTAKDDFNERPIRIAELATIRFLLTPLPSSTEK